MTVSTLETLAIPLAEFTETVRLLPSIDLDTLNLEAAMMTRVDRKYVVSVADLGAIVAGCADTLRRQGEELEVLEIAGVRGGRYGSTYFDTPEATSFLAAARPRRHRMKIRTRSYLDSDLHFLEVKGRGARGVTIKQRVELPADAARSLDLAPAAEFLDPLLEQAGGEWAGAALAPVISGSYTRTTFKAGVVGRMTVDTHAKWWHPEDPGHQAELTGAVVETKSGSTPSAVDRTLWRLGYRPQKISKFGTGMAALNRDLPANRWHRILTTWVA